VILFSAGIMSSAAGRFLRKKNLVADESGLGVWGLVYLVKICLLRQAALHYGEIRVRDFATFSGFYMRPWPYPSLMKKKNPDSPQCDKKRQVKKQEKIRFRHTGAPKMAAKRDTKNGPGLGTGETVASEGNLHRTSANQNTGLGLRAISRRCSSLRASFLCPALLGVALLLVSISLDKLVRA